MPDAALGSASHVCIGATDVDATVAFFEQVDFRVVRREGDTTVIDRGLGASTELVISSAPAGRRLVDYDLGPRGLDVYTRDIGASLARLSMYEAGPIGDVVIGPIEMRQVTVWGPDDIPLVLIEHNSPRPSLLDDHPDELHSEIHSLVWGVADRDGAAAWFADRGCVAGTRLAFTHPEVSKFMGLPDPDAALEMVMLTDEPGSAIRFELMAFPGTSARRFDGADHVGIQAIGYTTDALEPGRLATPDGVVLDVRRP